MLMAKESRKAVRVCGTAVVSWTVELPADKQAEGATTDDPAVNAVVDFLPQSGRVWLWGEDCEPASVHLDISDGDFEIEEDERGFRRCDWPGCTCRPECTMLDAEGENLGSFCKKHGQLALASGCR